MTEETDKPKKSEAEERAEIVTNFKTILDSWPLIQLANLEAHARLVAMDAILLERAKAAVNRRIVDSKGIDPENLPDTFGAIGVAAQELDNILKSEAAKKAGGKSLVEQYNVTPGDPDNVFEQLATLLKETAPLGEEANRIQREAFPKKDTSSVIDE